MKKKLAVLPLAALALCSFVMSGCESGGTAARPVTVLCYGDSNTYGYDPNTGGRYPAGVRWTNILADKLGSGYRVIDEGLNGRTTVYDRPDGAWKNGYPYLTPCLGSHKPIDVLVFMLGTNDCNSDLGLSAEDIAAGMEKLVCTAEEMTAELQGYVPKMIIVVPAAIKPDFAGTPFEYQLDEAAVRKSHDIAPLYEKLAKEHGCMFLDGSDSLEVSDIDCEHLTENGHSRLADMLYELITD